MAKKYVKFLVGLVFFSYVFSNPFTPAGHEGFVYENPRVFGKGGFRGEIIRTGKLWGFFMAKSDYQYRYETSNI